MENLKKNTFIFLTVFIVLTGIAGIICSIFDLSMDIMKAAGEEFSRYKGLSPGELTGAIFFKNVTASLFVAFISCYLAGLPIFLFLGVNTVLIGAVLSVYPALIIGILPHGVIEIPAVCVALALGWHIWRRKEKGLVKIHRRDLLYFVKTVVPLLVIAALIEVFITPYFIEWFLADYKSPF